MCLKIKKFFTYLFPPYNQFMRCLMSLRPTPMRYWYSRGWYTVNHMDIHRGLNFNMFLMILEVCSHAIFFVTSLHSLDLVILSWMLFIRVFFSDIFIEIFDDENILQDRGASNPVVRKKACLCSSRGLDSNVGFPQPQVHGNSFTIHLAWMNDPPNCPYYWEHFWLNIAKRWYFFLVEQKVILVGGSWP